MQPTFELPIQAQALAVSPHGRAALVDTLSTPLPDLNAALRELRKVTLPQAASTNPTAQVHANIAGPGSRFYFANPSVALGATLGAVAFVEKVSVTAGDTDEYTVKLKRLDALGDFVGDELDIASAETWNGDPTVRIAVNSAGQMALVYFHQLYTRDHFALGRVLDPTGQPVGPELTLNTNKADSGLYSAWDAVVAIGQDGSSAFAWDDSFRDRYDFTPGQKVFMRLVDAAAQPLGGPVQVSVVSNSVSPEIGIGPDGTVTVVWQGGADPTGPRIYLRRYAADGSPTGPEAVLSPNRGQSPGLAYAPDGRHVVVWRGPVNRGEGIVAQRFSPDGLPYGRPVVVAELQQEAEPRVGIATDGTYLVAWGTSARWMLWETEGSPAVLAHPASVSRNVGGAAAFEIVAAGTEPLYFQWQHNCVDIPGATNATLALSNLRPENGGSYRAIVFSPLGQAISLPGVLGDLNDLFRNRTPIQGLAGRIRGSNDRASLAVESWEGGQGRSVWWTWTAPRTGSVTITNTGISFAHQLYVWSGDTLQSLVPVNGMYSSLGQKKIVIPVQAGVHYQIQVSQEFPGDSGAHGIIDFAFSMPDPPELKLLRRPNGTVQLDVTSRPDLQLRLDESADLDEWGSVRYDRVSPGEPESVFLWPDPKTPAKYFRAVQR